MISFYVGSTPRNTLRVSPVLAYTNLKVGLEGTRVLMRRQTLDVLVRIRFASWNVGTFLGTSEEIAETLRGVASIFVLCWKLDGNEKLLPGTGKSCYGAEVVQMRME